MDTTPSPFEKPQDWSWPWWPLVPLYPFGQRRTLCTEVVPDTVWMFEQIQGVLYVVVPIRMTVVRLESGGLLVYAPIAPTRECMQRIQVLEAQYGAVKYIVLPTISGLEHKVFVVPFARQCPEAQIFVAPQQWSFPVNLPLSWLGFPMRRTHILDPVNPQVPFADEFDLAILGPIQLGLGPFGEVALFHKRSRTLLVTDTVVSIPEDPPAIVQLDPYALLFHAKDQAADVIEDNAAHRRKGWQRIVLFAFYFQPSALETIPWGQTWQEAKQSRDRSAQALWGLYPFRWQSHWQESFAALHGNGRLLVAPVLRTLILNRAPQETLAWCDRIAAWNFERIIPCHLQAPISATPQQFREAFTFLQTQPATSTHLPGPDFECLENIDKLLTKISVTPPKHEKI